MSACLSARSRASLAIAGKSGRVRIELLPRMRRSPSSTTALVSFAPISMPATKTMTPPLQLGGGLRRLTLSFECSLQREDRRSERADVVGIRADVELHAEFFFQRVHHADVARDAAGERHLRLDADPADERNRARGD